MPVDPRPRARALTPLRRTTSAGSLLTLGLLTACSASSEDEVGTGGGGSTTPIPVASISGVVKTTQGLPLGGIDVKVADVMVTTDVNGLFIVGFPEALPAQNIDVEIDPSTSTIAGAYPRVRFDFGVFEGDDAATLPYEISLPNLEDPSGDFDFVALNGNSFTTVPKVLTAASNIELNVPSSTLITIDGQSAANEIVQLSITPISGLDLPYPAFTGQAAAGYVAIGPFDASFDPIGVADGLTVTLPNTNQFPTGTTLSVYAYDDVLDGWVNRSQQTGEFASVQGDKIIAPGVVTRGGIYTAGGIVSDLCATTVQGRIFDVAGLAVADASIALSTGQKTLTDADGSFSIPLVPAVNYDALLSTPPLCVPEAISYRVTRSAQDGGDRSNIGLIPSPISGGTTNLGDIVVNEFAPVSTASVVGILTGSEAEPAVLVDLLGPSGSDQSIEAASSQFFRLGLEPGFYTASTEFEFSTAPTFASASLAAGDVGVLTLSPDRGAGTGLVDVFVGLEDGSTATPVDGLGGVQVLLFGTDEASSEGILRVTKTDGTVRFQDVDGPFTISAQTIVSGGAGNDRRLATTWSGLSPQGEVQLVLSDIDPLEADVDLSGTFTNLPVSPVLTSWLLLTGRGDVNGQYFRAEVPIADDGSYSATIPSGVTLDAMYLARDASDGALIGFKYYPEIPGFDGGVAASQDFDVTLDFLTDTVLFALPLNLFPVGLAPEETSEVSLDLTLPGGGGRNISLDVGNLGSKSGAVNLPDLGVLDFAGFSSILRVDAVDDFGSRREYSIPLTFTPKSLAIEFDTAPVVISPEPEATLGAQALADALLEVEIDTEIETDTVVRVQFNSTGGELALGVDRGSWTLYVRASDLPAMLPLLPFDVWVSGMDVTLTATTLRTDDAEPTLEALASEPSPLAVEIAPRASNARSDTSTIDVVGP